MQNVNWLTELSSFSDRYLLPDDVIADSMTGSVQRDGSGKIVLKGRIVEELSKTDQLIKALQSRPYEVEPMDTGTVSSDQKSEYSSTFVYHLQLPPSAMTDLSSLNRRAAEYVNKSYEAMESAGDVDASGSLDSDGVDSEDAELEPVNDSSNEEPQQ